MLRCLNDSCAGPGGNRLASALDNISLANPSVDVLEAYYRNISGYYETDFPDRPPHVNNFTAEELDADNVTVSDQGTKVRVFNYNESVEIVFQGTDILNSVETHPMHPHGFRFYIIGMGVGNFDNETTYNLLDPPEENTLALPKDSWATIRFRADNVDVQLP